MKISIIVPVYNAEKYLNKCIESITNQTIKDLEILLINDGSTDHSLKICREYETKDARIRVIDKKNSGPSDTRNLGIKKSTGDYILFVDSDDYIENTMLEEMYQKIVEEEVDVVRCNIKKYKNEIDYQIENMYELANKKITQEKIGKILFHFLTLKENLGCYSVLLLIKKSVIQKFNTNIRFMEDYEYYARLLLNITSIYFLDKPLYHYRYNGVGLSKSEERAMKNILDMTEVMIAVEKILQKKDLEYLIKEINTTYFSIWIAKMMIYLDCGYQQTRKKIKELLKNNEIKARLINLNFSSLNKVKKVEYLLLKYHFYFTLYIVLKLISKVRR